MTWSVAGPAPAQGWVITDGKIQTSFQTATSGVITLTRLAGEIGLRTIYLGIKGSAQPGFDCGTYAPGPILATSWRPEPPDPRAWSYAFSQPNAASALNQLSVFEEERGHQIEYSRDGSTWTNNVGALGVFPCNQATVVTVKAAAGLAAAAPIPDRKPFTLTNRCNTPVGVTSVYTAEAMGSFAKAADMVVYTSFASPGSTVDVEYVYVSPTAGVGQQILATQSVSLAVKNPTTPIPSAARACTNTVRAVRPPTGVVVKANSAFTRTLSAAEIATCDQAALAAASSTSAPGSGAANPASGPTNPSSTQPSAAAPARPATTGGGGASSASVGAQGSQAGAAINGGPGATAGVRVFSAPCLASEGLYANMAGSVGSSFVMAPDLRSGVVPSSFAVTSGALPVGIRLNPAAGVVYGVPTQTDAGSTPITITATNPDGSTTASSFSFPVDDPHHSVSYPVRVIAALGEPVDVFHHAKGNSGPASYSLVCGTMPSGLVLDPRTGIIAGTPTIQVQYPIPLRVRQVDEHGWVDASMMLLVDGSTNPLGSLPASS